VHHLSAALGYMTLLAAAPQVVCALLPAGVTHYQQQELSGGRLYSAKLAESVSVAPAISLAPAAPRSRTAHDHPWGAGIPQAKFG